MENARINSFWGQYKLLLSSELYIQWLEIDLQQNGDHQQGFQADNAFRIDKWTWNEASRTSGESGMSGESKSWNKLETKAIRGDDF